MDVNGLLAEMMEETIIVEGEELEQLLAEEIIIGRGGADLGQGEAHRRTTSCCGRGCLWWVLTVMRTLHGLNGRLLQTLYDGRMSELLLQQWIRRELYVIRWQGEESLEIIHGLREGIDETATIFHLDRGGRGRHGGWMRMVRR